MGVQYFAELICDYGCGAVADKGDFGQDISRHVRRMAAYDGWKYVKNLNPNSNMMIDLCPKCYAIYHAKTK